MRRGPASSKGTCCKFVWRNVTGENQPSSVALKKNMKDIWKAANPKDFVSHTSQSPERITKPSDRHAKYGSQVKKFPVNLTLPYVGFGLPVPFATAKHPEDKAKLFDDFKLDAMKLRQEILDHLGQWANQQVSADNAKQIWVGSGN